jgi:hypothetical protein
MIVNYSDQDVAKAEQSIFLAGPTPRKKGIISWRKSACAILEKLDFDGVVYSPEYSTWKPRGNYNDQALWERKALELSTVIVFWIPRSLPDMPAFTTNVEFGYWINTDKIVYGRPDDAIKIKYLDLLYRYEYSREPKHNLTDTLKEAIEMIKELEINS